MYICTEVAEQPLLKPSSQTATGPSQSPGYQPLALPSSDRARGQGRTRKQLRIQTLHSSKLLFLIRGFQNDTFEKSTNASQFSPHFFPDDTGLFAAHSLLLGDKQQHPQVK